jgi:hypothetical protein
MVGLPRDFLWSLVALSSLMRLSLLKAAHVAVGECRVSGNPGRPSYSAHVRWCEGHPSSSYWLCQGIDSCWVEFSRRLLRGCGRTPLTNSVSQGRLRIRFVQIGFFPALLRWSGGRARWSFSRQPFLKFDIFGFFLGTGSSNSILNPRFSRRL